MKNIKWRTTLLTLTAALALSACSGDSTEPKEEDKTQEESPKSDSHATMDHSNMDHSSSGEVPETLKDAENPTYPVGRKALITDSHMDGMEGAVATIVGAYDTTAYIISYNPTTGGTRVEQHKWVIHEELIDAGTAPLAVGTEVRTDATHMEGMANAVVIIEEAIPTTVYMIDYSSTTDEQAVKNHKWVTESELSPTE
ncbi:MAG: YdhK family protein [Lysinibacillus sp.]